MSRLFRMLVIFGLLLSFSATPAYSSPPDNLAPSDAAQSASGMPGWPLPAQPIPHHEPGAPARSAAASYPTTRLNAQGETEAIQLQGLDALLADGTLNDPLQGNYNLVNLDKFMFSAYAESTFAYTSFGLDDAEPPALVQVPGSLESYGSHWFNDIAAADLNGDYVAEQIAAWVNTTDQHILMSAGELPGSFGKATSAPAAVAYADGSLELLVRGFDHALWSLPYDGATWGSWSNAAGGILLSGPAVASRADGELDVFAIGADNQVYHQHKAVAWEGWTLVDGGGIFPPLARPANLPPVPAPAVVAHPTGQLDLFRIGLDQTLWWCHSEDGLTWDAWENLGGMLASTPGAVQVKDGPMQVYALGLDGAVWYRTYTGSWAAWQRQESPQGVAWNAVPTLTSPAEGQVSLYLAGTENRIWKNDFNGSAWLGWNSTEVTGGELDAGIAAAASPGNAFLFAQLSGGSLQYSLNAAGWIPLPGLDISHTVFDTGAVTKPLPAAIPLENSYLDLSVGYFTGDGRQQVVLAYANIDDQIMVEIYDVDSGFRLHKIASLSAPVAAGWPRVAAGDVDGDGVDEIGLASVLDSTAAQRKLILQVFQVAKDAGGALTGALSEISYNEVAMDTAGGDIWNGFPFGGTLRIAAGDIVPEQDSNNDEFTIYSDWRHDSSGNWRGIYLYLHLYDHQSSPQMSQQVAQFLAATDDSYWNELYATGAGLAVGDVNGAVPGYGVDEIVITYPIGLDGNDYPDIGRDLRVYGLVQGETQVTELLKYYIPGYSRYSFLDTLAVADLDQDLVGEIVMAGHFGANNVSAGYSLDYYEFASLSSGPVDRWTIPYTAMPYAFNLAVGNFTGEGFQVGPPTYREQLGMISPEVLLNLPPMHRDIIDGVEYTIDNGAIAVYTAGNTNTLQTASESKRDWSLSVGLEMSVGAAGHTVTTSLENTYGENFSTATTAINTVEFEDTTTADNYDQVIFNATRYAIWEYPVLGVETSDPDQPATIAVVWPKVETTTSPKNEQGRKCDENFYTPTHQPYNVWSYDRVGDVLFGDYDPTREVDNKETAGGRDFEIRMSTVSEAMRSDSFHNQVSAGLEYSYETSLDIPLVGKAWEFSFRASTNAEYGIEEISTLTSTFTEETSVEVDFPSNPNPSNYTIKAYLYWARAGYLVLDYQTAPDPNSGDWQKYNKTDPAFTLPWYGFPDPLTGVFPSTGDDQPPCGLGKQLFTHDIQADPAYAENGDTVTLHADLRNFSAVIPPADVAVRFYLGYPAASNQIGSCSIPRMQLNRAAGPAGCSITWTVNGASGEERIYASLDPQNAFDEMHDGNDVINNNIGYGLLQVANADYFDPGLRQAQAYQAILYEEATGLDYGLYLPTSNGSATIRYELVPTDLDILTPVIGVPIQVLAFLGGERDATPNFPFGDTPAGLMISYRDADLAGMQESALRLYRLDGLNWIEAACPGYEPIHLLSDNAIAVPICQSGTFILSDEPPIPFRMLFLPITRK